MITIHDRALTHGWPVGTMMDLRQAPVASCVTRGGYIRPLPGRDTRCVGRVSVVHSNGLRRSVLDASGPGPFICHRTQIRFRHHAPICIRPGYPCSSTSPASTGARLHPQLRHYTKRAPVSPGARSALCTGFGLHHPVPSVPRFHPPYRLHLHPRPPRPCLPPRCSAR